MCNSCGVAYKSILLVAMAFINHNSTCTAVSIFGEEHSSWEEQQHCRGQKHMKRAPAVINAQEGDKWWRTRKERSTRWAQTPDAARNHDGQRHIPGRPGLDPPGRAITGMTPVAPLCWTTGGAWCYVPCLLLHQPHFLRGVHCRHSVAAATAARSYS